MVESTVDEVDNHLKCGVGCCVVIIAWNQCMSQRNIIEYPEDKCAGRDESARMFTGAPCHHQTSAHGCGELPPGGELAARVRWQGDGRHGCIVVRQVRGWLGVSMLVSSSCF
jgi:hypothetical protein